MDWTLEVVILPVSDIDRSVAFYRDKVRRVTTGSPGAWTGG
jgi:catechol 2,3-dioxygenase-like lactoylglutathione lyase family enzyme